MGPGGLFSGLSTFKPKASLPGQIRDPFRDRPSLMPEMDLSEALHLTHLAVQAGIGR